MRSKKSTHDNLRINLVIIGFTAVSAIFIVRLFTLQVLSHAKYKALAQDQYWNTQDLPAKRGDILSSDGFRLASTQTYYLLYAEPQKVIDKYKTANMIAEKLVSYKNIPEETDRAAEFKRNYDRILEIFNSNLVWAILSKNLSPVQRDDVASLNLPGIGFEDAPVRFYPEGTLASHILGFVASDDKGDNRGYYGIEGNFDGDLKGKPGKVVQEEDATGAPILVGGFKKIPPIDGRSIVLSINRSVQYIVEKKLKEGVEKYDAAAGSVIVMNPQTGDIIALANYPSYDPANFADEDEPLKDNEHRKNIERKDLAISETYEPGSVIKPLTVSTAIDLKKITPYTTFDDAGPVVYSGHVIDNWNGKHLGVQNIIQLLQKSNNIGAAWVGHQVGSQSLSKYFKNFGLGEKSNVDLEGEDTGVIHDYNDWTDIDLANISFGQGISATPLQVLNAFNVLINGGTLLQPRIVTTIVDNGHKMDIPVKKLRRVISQDTSKTMIDMLVQAVEGGESKFYNSKNYLIGGKTGTAQIFVNGKYDERKSNATFVGFFAGPKNISMIVRLQEPSTSIYAAETAVPLWMSIAEELAKQYGITPDLTTSSTLPVN